MKNTLTIDWLPDKTLTKPLYQQIIDFIKDKIVNGEWTIGSRLPSQRELAGIWNVNRSTLIEAVEELKAEGLIEGKGSGGTVIVNNTWSLLASNPPPNWQNYILSGIHKPNLPTIQLINKIEFEPDIIRLGTGELSPDLFPHDIFKQVMAKSAEKINSLGYVEPKGLLYLRETISQHLRKWDIQVSPASILIVSGSVQALHLISIGLLQPNSKIYIEEPSYIKSLHVFQSAGMNLKPISMDQSGIIPQTILRDKDSSATTLLYTIPTFQNPTGIVMTIARRKQILNLCEQLRIPIIEDDAYRELWLDKPPPKPLKSMDKNGMVLYMGTVSKSLAAGFRIGWLIGPEPVIDRLGDIKMQTDYGASSLSQWVLAEWLASGLYEQNLARLRDNLKIRRQLTLSILNQHYSEIASWITPQGGYFIWLRLKKKISLNQLFSMAYQEKILINPGNVYDFSATNQNNIRLSYSYASLQDLEQGLIKLAELIKLI